jgi:pimeloyl-ACP methyl ester carboxylesterase
VVIEDAGHFNFAEQPESFFGAVRSWLDRHRVAEASLA